MKRGFSIQQQLTLAFTAMALLVLIASGIGYWFTIQIETTISTTSKDISNTTEVRQLRENWLIIFALVDNLIITHQTTQIEPQLTTQNETYKNQIKAIQEKALGNGPQMIAQNRKLQNELNVLSNEVISVVNEIILQANKRRWGQALSIRQNQLEPFRSSLDNTLNQLISNIQDDASASLIKSARLQNRARTYWIITIVMVFVEGSLLIYLMLRSITEPIRQLTANIQRVTQGDFSPVTPFEQQNEIGELSRAFSLLTNWLRESYETLEQRVATRTRDLERRSLQVQVASEVAREATLIRNTGELLEIAVNLIRGRFGFYHTNLFMIDNQREFAELKAATGEAGRQLLSENFKVRIGDEGIVGYVSGAGKARIVNNIRLTPEDPRINLLPEVRSEMGIPLTVAERVIGVLEVYSHYENAFTEDDVVVMKIIADQLAVAIENARLVSQLQEKLGELETLYGRYSQDAWLNLLKTSKIAGYQYDQGNIAPLLPINEAIDFASQGSSSAVSLPLTVRGTRIGKIDVWPRNEEISNEELSVLENVGARVSQALESARLYQETQQKAEFERLLSDAMSRIRQTLDMEIILQTAVYEMQRILNLEEVEIRLGNVDMPYPGIQPQEQTKPINSEN